MKHAFPTFSAAGVLGLAFWNGDALQGLTHLKLHADGAGRHVLLGVGHEDAFLHRLHHEGRLFPAGQAERVALAGLCLYPVRQPQPRTVDEPADQNSDHLCCKMASSLRKLLKSESCKAGHILVHDYQICP